MANGYITIGTELKTDKFDKQIASLERKMEQEEKKKIELNFDVKEQEFIQAKKQYDELNQKVDQYKRKLETLKDMPRIAKEQGQDIKPLWKYLEELQSAKTNYGKAIEDLQKQEGVMARISGEYQKQRQQVDAINNKISEYKQKAESIRFNKQQAEIEQVKQGFDKVGNSIQSAVKQAGRMVLSIIGIRTGLAMLRRASGELATYDTQYAANLEYIRFALTQMIAPVLRYIVELVATILQYINAILSAWFGINLFSNASAKNFQKMKAGAGGTAKAVKEIKKQLAGFDEINMLSDTSSSGGGGGGGIASPSFDLGSDVKIPKWLQWIIDNKDLILAILGGIAAAIIAIKAGLGGIKALGIGILVTGIIKLIKDLLKYLDAPTWENFGNIIQDIGLILIGLGTIIGGLPAIVAGVALLIVGYVVKHWEQIREKIQNGIDWLRSKTDWVKEHFGVVGEAIYTFFINKLQSMFDKINWIITKSKEVFDGLIWFLKNAFAGKWNEIFEGIKNKASQIWQKIKSTALDIFSTIVNSIITKINDLIAKVQYKISLIRDFFRGIVDTVQDWFTDIGVAIPENIANAFRGVINKVLSSVENTLNKAINTVNSMINAVNNLPRCKYFNKIKHNLLAKISSWWNCKYAKQTEL